MNADCKDFVPKPPPISEHVRCLGYTLHMIIYMMRSISMARAMATGPYAMYADRQMAAMCAMMCMYALDLIKYARNRDFTLVDENAFISAYVNSKPFRQLYDNRENGDKERAKHIYSVSFSQENIEKLKNIERYAIWIRDTGLYTY